MAKYARKYVRRKKERENGGGSHEEEESRDLGTENRGAKKESVGDGPPQRQEGGNSSRKRRVRFACEEEMDGDEGGGSRDETVVPCEEGEMTEGTVNCVQHRSPMKLRSRDRGGKRKVMYDDSEYDGCLAKKRARRREQFLKFTKQGPVRRRKELMLGNEL